MSSCVSDYEITFVVQGAINERYTKVALESIRRHFPGSTIILSTWMGASLTGLDFDECILSEDPGAVHQSDDPKILDNVNRQIISSVAGLRVVQTKFAVKTRTDFVFRGKGFVHWLNNKLFRDSEYAIFTNRVVIPNYNVKNHKRMELLFHPSDLVVAGLTSDVLSMFDVPLRSGVESRLFSNRPKPYTKIHPSLLSRYTAEQYIWLSSLNDELLKDFDFYAAFSDELKAISDNYLASNFIVLSAKQFGVKFVKYPFREYKSWSSYTHNEWLHLLDDKEVNKSRCYLDFDLIGNVLYEKLRLLYKKMLDKIRFAINLYNRK